MYYLFEGKWVACCLEDKYSDNVYLIKFFNPHKTIRMAFAKEIKFIAD